MGTGAALIRRSDQGLEGLILEKVNGMPLEKRYLLSDKHCLLCPVRLIHILLFCQVILTGCFCCIQQAPEG